MKTPAKSIAQRHGYRGLQRSDGPALLPEEPLWRRVPSRDEEGRCLADFRMTCLLTFLSNKPDRDMFHTGI
ncbi:hypothetical protein HAP97_13830, partial [Acidithiobacillus caldus]|nr:hypothetical protein [Acidithiobacillus caldus]